MDPAASSASTATSANDPSNRRRGGGRRGGSPRRQQQQQQQQQPSEGASRDSQPKNKGSNNRRHDNRKKDGEGRESSRASAPNPRGPRTITDTDPINLQVGKEVSSVTTTTTTTSQPEGEEGDEADDKEEHACFICTENIVIFAVSDCNHRTCHLCSLRLRALYKTRDCTYCKAEQNIMIFTRDPQKSFQDYDFKTMAYFDRKLNVYFEDQEMYEDTMVILRFNCPEPTCDVACPEGWKQLKSHVKNVHKLMLCDLCVRHKKVFAHEHNLMNANQLHRHFKSGDSGQTNQNSAEPTGFKGHPQCGFCRESFYGDDELFDHCKQNHEQCFLCMRRNIRHEYYDKYRDLERHLQSEHYACMDPECLEKKFVVFDSELDLMSHEAEAHPHLTHGRSKGHKIDLGFTYNPSSDSSSRRGGRNNRQNGRDQGRRQQEEETTRAPQLTPHQVQQIARQRELDEEREQRAKKEALEAAQNELSDLSLDPTPAAAKSMLRTQPPAGFGSSLTEPTPVVAQSSPTSAAARVAANIQRTSSPMRPSSPAIVTQSKADWPAVSASAAPPPPSSSPGPSSTSRKPATGSETLNKHAALQEQVGRYLQGTSGSLSQFRTLTTQYRNSQIPGTQYVVSISGLFGSDLDKTGKVIQGVYEVLDSETKKAEMMRAWRDYKTTQTQFPSLESTVTSNPTMADIATPSARRVLVIKSSGTTRGSFGQARPKSTATWERAAAAASSVKKNDSTKSASAAPVFYPTPQPNSAAPAWAAVPKGSTDPANTPEPSSSSSSAANANSGGRGQWAGISHRSGSGSSSPTPQFRASAGQGRLAVTNDQFPSLVSQSPAGTKPGLGLLPATSKKNQAGLDDTPSGWVTGWNNDTDDEPTGGKKKKNKKKILFHVG
ncbi:hypothetical protein B0O80DRAFT_501880 [Mortierella sp. GBAus27b]|nr:hypothetical protein BGX31_003769 [Mortierella sp. GBA43]KAI8348510.1 hypothetical protein B0O80DRAFT_501880 [Mortierella sp. GBAus27b]